jgi:hypothetical protein
MTKPFDCNTCNENPNTNVYNSSLPIGRNREGKLPVYQLHCTEEGVSSKVEPNNFTQVWKHKKDDIKFGEYAIILYEENDNKGYVTKITNKKHANAIIYCQNNTNKKIKTIGVRGWWNKKYPIYQVKCNNDNIIKDQDVHVYNNFIDKFGRITPGIKKHSTARYAKMKVNKNNVTKGKITKIDPWFPNVIVECDTNSSTNQNERTRTLSLQSQKDLLSNLINERIQHEIEEYGAKKSNPDAHEEESKVEIVEDNPDTISSLTDSFKQQIDKGLVPPDNQEDIDNSKKGKSKSMVKRFTSLFKKSKTRTMIGGKKNRKTSRKKGVKGK